MFATPTVSAEASNNNHPLNSSIPMQQLPAGQFGAAAPLIASPVEAAEFCLATCCLRRASNSRKENYVYTIGKKAGWRTNRRLLTSSLASHVFPGRSITIDAMLQISSTAHTQQSTDSNNHCNWEAFVANEVMFVCPPAYDIWAANEFRESVIALLELAEGINCGQVVICLKKERTDSSDMMRAFMYAGFELVYPNVFQHDSSFVLLGSEV
ncbi:acyl-CoA N-acyltransferase [Syncephalis fuscata]|nr:acyl-CoA N-acyltransferase [Syncephalis fuscata]